MIEAITLICSAVSDEVFRPHADKIVQAMIFIQKSKMDDNDPQRSYLLTAWQRICLKMKGDFAPFLNEIMPPILSTASLKPTMGIEGTGAAELTDVLNEIKPEGQGEKKTNVMTDEIDEKDTAIQMLIVFLEELGTACFPFFSQLAPILLGLTQFSASDNIRNSAAGALPSLFKCWKDAQTQTYEATQEMAREFCNNVIDAMESETETDCLICQA